MTSDQSPAGRPLLSFCYFGRNDEYFGDYKYRLRTSLDLLCSGLEALGRLDAVEIILSDWGSAVPLAHDLPLGATARSKVKFLYVPPGLARRTHDDPTLPATLALNAAFRRAEGEFISTMDADILLTPSSLRALFEVLEGRIPRLNVGNVLWFANRRQLPSNVVDRKLSALEIEEYLNRNLAYLKSETLGNGYGGGALYLMQRELLLATRGLDERMRWWGWSDSDLSLRCNQRFPTLDLNNFGVLPVHQENSVSPHGPVPKRKFNLPDYNPDFAPNGEQWGLAGEALSFTKATGVQAPSSPDRTSRAGTAERWAMTRDQLARALTNPENEERIQPILKFVTQFMRADPRETNALKTLSWYAASQSVVTFIEMGMRDPLAACTVVHIAHGAEVHGLHAFVNFGPGPETAGPAESCNYFQTSLFRCVDALRLVGRPMGYARFTGGNPAEAVGSLAQWESGRFAYDLALIRSGPSSPYGIAQGVQLARHVRPGGALVVYGENGAAFQAQFAALADANPSFVKSLWPDGQTGLLLAATLAG